ncbi:MAG: AAA family ATPase [Chloroflexota bacterium]
MSSLPPVAQALLSPLIYPDPASRVELAQTQMSFVFLAGDYVYKVKKPVNLGYLDYTTLEKRRRYCQKEVELNQRLCPEAYLGVVALTRDDRGNISLGGKGEVVEYAVKMRRLPEQKMMNNLLAAGQVLPEMIVRVARKLADFHARAETSPAISTFGDLPTLVQNTEENFSQTEKYIPATLSPKRYQLLTKYTRDFMENQAALFQKRVREGRVRDCHGDLHAAHICFTDGICIYDCIEFNDRFRYCDVASELAFLAMDLDHYGRADLSYTFTDTYIQESQDGEIERLLPFYKCYRAYVRGKVEGFKLDDPYISPPEKEKVREVASSYFSLAHAYTRGKPLLFITVGLVGTGKTTLAQALARRLGLVAISSDVTRKRLAGIPLTEHRYEEFDSGLYSAGFTRRTYDAMFAEARSVLSRGGSVILDASFVKAGERRKARELAQETGAGFYILECVLDPETIRKNLAQRKREGSVSDGRWEIYQPQRKEFEPVTEAEKHVITDSSRPLPEQVELVESIMDG